jgi:hypothetical protein
MAELMLSFMAPDGMAEAIQDWGAEKVGADLACGALRRSANSISEALCSG